MMDHPAYSIRALPIKDQKMFEPDEDGFIFFANIRKGERLPFDLAQAKGFTAPEFDIRSPVLSPGIPEQDREAYAKEYEGLFVRETWRKPADFSDCWSPFF